ncbi:MAG: hypothetical protein IIW54_13975 [Lachnospiraceae bacterium]|nr:hypothetical protein [Lachnospiraceae bacterium]MBQ5851900.1 hypothetical protein [Lachnospiraceae bacterium]
MKKGKIVSMLAVSIMSSVMLTGCIDAMPDMTEEQENMVAEYAAGLLLKYSPNYDYRLVSEREIEETIQAENEAALQKETTQIQESEMEKTEPDKTEENIQPDNDSSNEQQIVEDIDTDMFSADADIAQELGIEGLSVRYQSYEVYDTYPKENSGFSLSAANGKKLLIVYFDVENTTDEDMQVDFNEYNIKGKVKVNDERASSVLNTMLVDDMISYIGQISAGETLQLVFATEVSEEAANEIESIKLDISGNGNSVSIPLK